jgi:hypothetical protein
MLIAALVVGVSLWLARGVRPTVIGGPAEPVSGALVSTTPTPGTPTSAGATATCAYAKHSDGRWYAGHSTTNVNAVNSPNTSEDVLEVQCMLARLGYDPGPTDGVFGPRTESAVEKLQAHGHVIVDGVVGSRTWTLLRR